jgi:hypothetical protein
MNDEEFRIEKDAFMDEIIELIMIKERIMGTVMAGLLHLYIMLHEKEETSPEELQEMLMGLCEIYRKKMYATRMMKNDA